MQATAKIQAGICGFKTNVLVDAPSMFEPAAITIETNCEKIARFAEQIKSVNGLDEISKGYEGKILSEARKVLTS